MQAPRIETQTLPPPPGIIGSLRSGFDAIATHFAVILMPLALDLLLWLGPRLSPDRALQPMMKAFATMLASTGVQPAELGTSVDAANKSLQALNMLGILRTFPIGISSLMTSVMPTATPWGTPTVVEVAAFPQFLALSMLLTFVGWVLGGLYFQWVALLSTPSDTPEDRVPTGWVVVQSLVYAMIWCVVGWLVGPPLILMLLVLFMINGLLGEGVLLLLGFLSMWLIVPIFFSPHGIFVHKQNALASILSGFHMTRFTLPTSSLFVLTVFLLGAGLNFLWAMPTADSWLVIGGIFGHAFITTALLASSFIYYRNMSAWLQVALARLRAGLPDQQA